MMTCRCRPAGLAGRSLCSAVLLGGRGLLTLPVGVGSGLMGCHVDLFLFQNLLAGNRFLSKRGSLEVDEPVKGFSIFV